ncbi:MAG: hypothetical protein HW421_773 [Ignavibacteria bacterium]|nr:hypothetical protein [Ignavibacteria bacterium]
MNINLIKKDIFRFGDKLVNKFNQANPHLIAFSILILLFIISYFSRNMSRIGCDLTEYLNNPIRILNGELPYRDFWLLFTPGEVYFPALIIKLFGINIDYIRNATILFSSAAGVCTFYFGKLLVKTNTRAILLTLTFFYSSVITLYVGPDYINLYLLFILLSAITLTLYIKGEKPVYVFLSGFFIGCSLTFRFYDAGAAAAAFLLTLVIYCILYKKSLRFKLKVISLYLSGICFIAIVIAIPFYDILPIFFREVVFESVSNGTSMNLPYFFETIDISLAMNRDIYTLMTNFSPGQIIFFIYHIIKILPMTLIYIIPFISIIVFIQFVKSKPDKRVICIALSLLLWGLISLPRGFGRSDGAHISTSSAPHLIMFWYLSVFYFGRNKESLLRGINRLFIGGTLSLMSLTLLIPVFNFVYLKKNPQIIINTKHGTLFYPNKTYASDVAAVIDFIEKNTKKDEFIFVTPWDAPPLYLLTERKNPTYFDSLNDLIVRPSKEKQLKVISDIIKHNTKVIIHDDNWGYDNKPEQDFSVTCSILQDFIISNYLLAEKHGCYSIYLKKN